MIKGTSEIVFLLKLMMKVWKREKTQKSEKDNCCNMDFLSKLGFEIALSNLFPLVTCLVRIVNTKEFHAVPDVEFEVAHLSTKTTVQIRKE